MTGPAVIDWHGVASDVSGVSTTTFERPGVVIVSSGCRNVDVSRIRSDVISCSGTTLAADGVTGVVVVVT